MFKITLEDGKYTFINDNGVVDILRHGEKWDTGNKAVLALLHEIEAMYDRFNDAESLLSEAQDTLDNMHGYDTDVYRAISEYFNGEEVEE